MKDAYQCLQNANNQTHTHINSGRDQANCVEEKQTIEGERKREYADIGGDMTVDRLEYNLC